MSIESIIYIIFIVIMLFNSIITKNNIIKLIINIFILILSYNLVHILGIYDIFESVDKTKYELIVISLLFMIASLDLNFFTRAWNNKQFHLYYIFIVTAMLSSFSNMYINLPNLVLLILYLQILYGFSYWKIDEDKLKRAVINMSLFFFLLMIVIYSIKFIQNPIIGFRVNRIQAIFPTVNEDGGFFLLFAIITYFSVKKKYIRFILFSAVIIILIFIIGNKTTIIAILFIILFYIFKKKKITVLLPILLIIFIIFNIIYEYIIFDVFSTFAYLTDDRITSVYITSNTFIGRITTVWLPTIIYTVNNSLLFGFGLGSWNEVTTASASSAGYFLEGYYHRAAHNFLVYYFAELGIIGLSAILAIFYKVTKRLYIIIKYNAKNNDDFYFSLFLAWIVFMITAFSANVTGIVGWVIIMMLYGITNHFLSQNKLNNI